MQQFLVEQSSGINNDFLRSANELIVLNVIRRKGAISRAEIARITDLKESTITSIARTLLDEGLIYEAEMVDSSGGRRPQNLRIASNRSACVGIRIGVRDTTLAVTNFGGELLHSESFRTDAEPKRFLRQLCAALGRVLAERIPHGLPVEGCGVSMPGLVDPAAGRIVYSANLGWRNVEIGEAARQVFDGELAFEDEVRATGLAELWFGSPENVNCRHLISLLVGEGIGAAIIIGGQLYRGATLGAGQFGHISLHPEGPACRCGNRGCWEVYASDVAAMQRYQATTSRSFTMKELIDRVLAGERAAVEAVQKTAEYLGSGIAVLANSLNPEEIILGGEIARAWPVIEDAVWSSLRKKALAANIAFLKLRPTTIAGDAILKGAISLVISRRFLVRRSSDPGRGSRATHSRSGRAIGL